MTHPMRRLVLIPAIAALIAFSCGGAVAAAEGTHEELLAHNGVYAEMHRIQNPAEDPIAAAPAAA